ncbi:MAG: hypothetical protein OXD35_11195 [Thiotrichales bacterium]|nr:hypothetical protein [Thiotrichales bacterium]
MAYTIDTRHGARAALAAAGLAFLAACGGGGNGEEPIRELIAHGWLPPLETARAQNERALAILPEVDSEFISTTYSENSIPNSPRTTIRHTCTGTETGCARIQLLNGRETENPATHVPANGELVIDGTQTPFRSKNGVTLIRTHRNTVSPTPGDPTTGRETRLGAWMEHGHFQFHQASAERLSPSYFGDRTSFAYAYGDLTRSAPAASATWKGVMVGGQAFGGGVGSGGHALIGDAELVFDLETASLDARFSGIVNADDPDEAHSVTGFNFSNVPVNASGVFQQVDNDDRIQGGFYGPEHAETVGVFEKANVVGAFGARN